jgi:hypothetical protein
MTQGRYAWIISVITRERTMLDRIVKRQRPFHVPACRGDFSFPETDMADGSVRDDFWSERRLLLRKRQEFPRDLSCPGQLARTR